MIRSAAFFKDNKYYNTIIIILNIIIINNDNNNGSLFYPTILRVLSHKVPWKFYVYLEFVTVQCPER